MICLHIKNLTKENKIKNVNKIITITFAIGSALAAAASVFYLIQIPSVEPTLGSMPGIKAFTAAVIGGIGSIHIRRVYVLEAGDITFSGKGDELLSNEEVKKAYLGE